MKRWVLLLVFFGCSKQPPPVRQLPYVKVAKPIVCDAPIYLEYVGHVEPNQSVHIKPQVSGVLTGQYFVEGQEVCENSLLLTLDPRQFQAELDKAQGELAQNLATLQQARDTANRYKDLVALNYISQLDYDQLLTNVLTAEAAALQSKADVEQAQINLSYCTIQAPIQGMTGKLLVNVGNYVTAGEDASLLTINQISPIRVSFYVPEKDFVNIACLQAKESLRVKVLRGNEWIEGSLFLIDNSVDETTGTILLQALFDNQNQQLWPGEFVDVRLILKIQKDAILVPTQAVSIGQDGPYLYVLKSNQTVELKKVKVGQKEDGKTWIESGITAEDTVIIEGQLNLNPGDKAQLKT